MIPVIADDNFLVPFDGRGVGFFSHQSGFAIFMLLFGGRLRFKMMEIRLFFEGDIPSKHPSVLEGSLTWVGFHQVGPEPIVVSRARN